MPLDPDLVHYVDKRFNDWRQQFNEYKRAQALAIKLFNREYESRHKSLDDKVNPLVEASNEEKGAKDSANWRSTVAIIIAATSLLVEVILRLFFSK